MRPFLSRSLAAAAAALGLACAAQAQGPVPQGRPQMPPTGPLVVHPLSPTVYWVSGGVGNCGFIVGKDGVIVVDATISPSSARELLGDIAKITPKPVTTVILTHGDIDHVGGLGAFPAGIRIIAQDNTKASMDAAAGAGRGPVPADHAPNHGVAEHEAAELNGVKLELLHWAPAHTAGDIVVYLPTQRIVFTGDIFALDQPRPLVHREENGDSAGWIKTAQGVMALDADRFVVGHGDLQDKASLQKRVDQAIQERAQIVALVAQGKSLAEIQTAVGDPPPGQAPAPGGPRFTPFSAVVYEELTAQK